MGRPDLRFCQKRIKMKEKKKGMVMMEMVLTEGAPGKCLLKIEGKGEGRREREEKVEETEKGRENEEKERGPGREGERQEERSKKRSK